MSKEHWKRAREVADAADRAWRKARDAYRRAEIAGADADELRVLAEKVEEAKDVLGQAWRETEAAWNTSR